MKKIILFICIFLNISYVLYANSGEVLVKGKQKLVLVFAQSAICYDEDMDTTKSSHCIKIPEAACNNLLYLVADGMTSWIWVQPGKTLNVDTRKLPWKFSGDGKDENRYLYNWTQDYWSARPNMLMENTHSMLRIQFPSERIFSSVNCSELYTREYMDWVSVWEQNSLKQLKKAKLKNDKFVKEQQKRIHFSWLDMQLKHYMAAKDKINIPLEATTFLRNEKFEDDDILNYPNINDIIYNLMSAADDLGLIEYTAKDFLVKRANLFASSKIKEYYILYELKNIIERAQWFYQADIVLESVKNMMVSESGKKQWMEYDKIYKDWLKSVTKPEGKDLVYFEFEDINGNKVKSTDFKGKYLFIDIWATWCGPCKYQIPFLKELAESFQGRDIAFLSISADKPSDKELWKKMLKEYGLENHGVISPDAFNHPLFERYEIRGIPRFILVDPNGKVVMSKARRPADPVLKMQLEELLDAYDERKVVIEGKVSGLRGGEEISLSKSGGFMLTLAKIPLTSENFVFPVDIQEAGYYTLSCSGRMSGELWLEPGNRVYLDISDKVVYSGANSELNNMLYLLQNRYRLSDEESTSLMYDQKRGKRIRSLYDLGLEEIEKSSLSSFEKDRLKGYWQGVLLERMYMMIAFSKTFGKAVKCPIIKKGYFDAIKNLDLSYHISESSRKGYVQEFLNTKVENGEIKITSIPTWLKDLSMGLEDVQLREWFIMYMLEMNIRLGGIKKCIDSVYPLLTQKDNLQKLQEIVQKIDKAHQNYKNAVDGTDVSFYKFENDKGETVALSDFKGKYIFIDLWATGCNPCVGEIPYIKNLEKRFSGQPIAWVSISTDTDKSFWKKFLVEKQMKGVQLIVENGNKHPFLQQIALMGIPRFVLLDKEGKMLDINTLRPSNPVLGELLDILLKGDK